MITLPVCVNGWGCGLNYGDYQGQGPYPSDAAQRTNGVVDDEFIRGYGDGIDYGDSEGDGWLGLYDLEEEGNDTRP